MTINVSMRICISISSVLKLSRFSFSKVLLIILRLPPKLKGFFNDVNVKPCSASDKAADIPLYTTTDYNGILKNWDSFTL